MNPSTPVSSGRFTSCGPLPLAGKPGGTVVGVRADGDTCENGVDVVPTLVAGAGVFVSGGSSKVFVGVNVAAGVDGVDVARIGVGVRVGVLDGTAVLVT